MGSVFLDRHIELFWSISILSRREKPDPIYKLHGVRFFTRPRAGEGERETAFLRRRKKENTMIRT